MDKYKLVPVEPTASPTSGMNLGQRIQHVGGWESERGTVEFGSVMAVGALVSHILRDIAVQGEPVAWRNIKEEKPEDGQDCITKMKHGIIQGTYCSEDDTFSGYYWREMGWYATHWVPAEEAIYTAPQPTEQQPAPDVEGLVDELEVLLVSGHLPRTWKERLSILLAAHRKQGGEV